MGHLVEHLRRPGLQRAAAGACPRGHTGRSGPSCPRRPGSPSPTRLRALADWVFGSWNLVEKSVPTAGLSANEPTRASSHSANTTRRCLKQKRAKLFTAASCVRTARGGVPLWPGVKNPTTLSSHACIVITESTLRRALSSVERIYGMVSSARPRPAGSHCWVPTSAFHERQPLGALDAS